MYTTCSELVVFMSWTGKSMNNLLLYCGLVDARISASEKDLPALNFDIIGRFVFEFARNYTLGKSTYFLIWNRGLQEFLKKSTSIIFFRIRIWYLIV